MGIKSLMEYKGYFGSYELSVEDCVFFGKIEFIKDLISYEGESAEEILTSFYDDVEDYIETCQKEGRQPDKPFKGSLNVRIGEELHRKVAMAARKKNLTINNYIKTTLKEKVS